MVNSVSSNTVSPQAAQPQPKPASPAQANPAQDSVHVSKQALAASGDVDHDGDSH